MDVCFYIASSRYGIAGFYPGPGGAIGSELPVPDWPALRRLQPDVEALIVRGGTAFITPVSAAYELTGLIRGAWTGFTGGDAMRVVDQFFDRLGRLAQEVMA